MLRLFLLFTIVPAVELYLLLQIGSVVGPTWTFLMVVAVGILGSWLAKREGLGLMRQLLDELNQGIPPGARLMEGVLVLVGSVLLITPGVLTDVMGIALIAPPSRRWLAPRVLAYLAQRFEIRGSVGPARPGRPEPERTPFANPFDDLP